jgi:Domain of unknown function (DUF4116)
MSAEDQKKLSIHYAVSNSHVGWAFNITQNRMARASERAYMESRILQQDERGDFIVAVPLTEFAARYWSEGTRWFRCGSDFGRNLDHLKFNFWAEHEETPQIIITIPELGERGKFRLSVSKEQVEFNAAREEIAEYQEYWGLDPRRQRRFTLLDKEDGGLPFSFLKQQIIEQYWDCFEPLLTIALGINGEALKLIPHKLRARELCQIAVESNGLALQYVPEEIKQNNPELWMSAVKQNGLALEFVPNDMRKPLEVCRAALDQNGMALAFVPARQRQGKEELVRIALNQNGDALVHTPDYLQTEEMFRLAVLQNGSALRHVPHKQRTADLCEMAVRQTGAALVEVPTALRTKHLCEIAIAQDGLALAHVPQSHHTPELIRWAIAHSGTALHAVSEANRTPELCALAVTTDWRALELVPNAIRTDEICRIAIRQNGLALKLMPENERTVALCEMAVKQNGLAIAWVPMWKRTPELCQIAVQQDWRAILSVPKSQRDAVMPSLAPPTLSWPLSLLDELEVTMNPTDGKFRLSPSRNTGRDRNADEPTNSPAVAP